MIKSIGNFQYLENNQIVPIIFDGFALYKIHGLPWLIKDNVLAKVVEYIYYINMLIQQLQHVQTQNGPYEQPISF